MPLAAAVAGFDHDRVAACWANAAASAAINIAGATNLATEKKIATRPPPRGPVRLEGAVQNAHPVRVDAYLNEMGIPTRSSQEKNESCPRGNARSSHATRGPGLNDDGKPTMRHLADFMILLALLTRGPVTPRSRMSLSVS